jgi:hypothetical protein
MHLALKGALRVLSPKCGREANWVVSVPSGTEQHEHELAALASIHSSIMTQSVGDVKSVYRSMTCPRPGTISPTW